MQEYEEHGCKINSYMWLCTDRICNGEEWIFVDNEYAYLLYSHINDTDTCIIVVV